MGPDGGEEEEGHPDFDDVGAHDTEFVHPEGEVVGEPGQGRGDALGLVVDGQGWYKGAIFM